MVLVRSMTSLLTQILQEEARIRIESDIEGGLRGVGETTAERKGCRQRRIEGEASKVDCSVEGGGSRRRNEGLTK